LDRKSRGSLMFVHNGFRFRRKKFGSGVSLQWSVTAA